MIYLYNQNLSAFVRYLSVFVW